MQRLDQAIADQHQHQHQHQQRWWQPAAHRPAATPSPTPPDRYPICSTSSGCPWTEGNRSPGSPNRRGDEPTGDHQGRQRSHRHDRAGSREPAFEERVRAYAHRRLLILKGATQAGVDAEPGTTPQPPDTPRQSAKTLTGGWPVPPEYYGIPSTTVEIQRSQGASHHRSTSRQKAPASA